MRKGNGAWFTKVLAGALLIVAAGCADEWIPDENGGGGEGIGTSPSAVPPPPVVDGKVPAPPPTPQEARPDCVTDAAAQAKLGPATDKDAPLCDEIEAAATTTAWRDRADAR